MKNDITLRALYRTDSGAAMPVVATYQAGRTVHVVFSDGSVGKRLVDELTPADPEDFPGVDFSWINLAPHPPRYLTEEQLRGAAPCWAEDNYKRVWHVSINACSQVRFVTQGFADRYAGEVNITRILDYPIPGKDEKREALKRWRDRYAFDATPDPAHDLPERVRVADDAELARRAEEIGLLKISRQQIADQLTSCETALAQRDDRIAALEEALAEVYCSEDEVKDGTD